MIMRDWVRNGIYQFLYSLTGAGRGIRVILLYHSVGNDAPHSVPLPLFEQQMEIVMKQFQVVRLRDLPAMITSSSPNTNIACVTFDDGYLDNYEYAFPVLQRLGIKATFFIATGFLAKSFPTFAGEYPMMTATQVRELAMAAHEVGAHTVSHPKLTKLSPETARKEVLESKELLEDLLGAQVVSFAYPNGDHNQRIRGLVGSVGLRFAVTIREGLVQDTPDWLALPRAWIHRSLDSLLFRAKLSPTLDRYHQLRKCVFIRS